MQTVKGNAFGVKASSSPLQVLFESSLSSLSSFGTFRVRLAGLTSWIAETTSANGNFTKRSDFHKHLTLFFSISGKVEPDGRNSRGRKSIWDLVGNTSQLGFKLSPGLSSIGLCVSYCPV